jgi:hypothetical protein
VLSIRPESAKLDAETVAEIQVPLDDP